MYLGENVSELNYQKQKRDSVYTLPNASTVTDTESTPCLAKRGHSFFLHNFNKCRHSFFL